MRQISLIMAYYENHEMLQRHLHNIRQYDKKARRHIELIVVDDGSPKAPARFDSDPPCRASIYRMKVDVRWNQDACRNIGAHHAAFDWLLLTDMDHIVPRETMHSLLCEQINPEMIYRFSRVSLPAMDPYKPHPNSWLMTKKMFYHIGGYDERLAGWYGTDGDFLDRAQETAPVIQLPYHIIRVPREVIPDASTTTLTRKSSEDAENIRRLRKLYAGTKPHTLTFPYEHVDDPCRQTAK